MADPFKLPVLPGLALCLALGVAGCDSPSPRMMSGERQAVVIDGTAFTVYRRGDAVEVYRTTPEFMPRRSVVFARAEQAVRKATGCAVAEGSLIGDAALMKAALNCG